MLKELSSVQEFIEFISQPDQRQLFVYFTATKKENGQPWCPDCATGNNRIFKQFTSINPTIMPTLNYVILFRLLNQIFILTLHICLTANSKRLCLYSRPNCT